jgi:hypothetical protein
MDIRLGCLQKNIDPELARVFQATNQFLGMYHSITLIVKYQFRVYKIV